MKRNTKTFLLMFLFMNTAFFSIIAHADDGVLTQIDYEHQFGASNLKITLGNQNPAPGISVQQQGLQLVNVTNLGRSGMEGDPNSYIYEALLKYEFKINVLSQIHEGEAFDQQLQIQDRSIHYLTIYGAPSHPNSLEANKWVRNYNIKYDGYNIEGRQISTKAQGYEGPIDVSVNFTSSTPDLSKFEERFANLGYKFTTDTYSANISQAVISNCIITEPDQKEARLQSDPNAVSTTNIINAIDFYTASVKTTLGQQLQTNGVGIRSKTVTHNIVFNGGQGNGIATSYTGDLSNINLRIKPDIKLIQQRIDYGFNRNLYVSTGAWYYSGRIEPQTGAYDSTFAVRTIGWHVKNYNVQMTANVFVRVATVITYASTTQAEDYVAPDPVVVSGDIVWDDYVNTAPLLFEEFEESVGSKFLNWLDENKVGMIAILILIVVAASIAVVIYIKASNPMNYMQQQPPKQDYYRRY